MVLWRSGGRLPGSLWLGVLVGDESMGPVGRCLGAEANALQVLERRVEDELAAWYLEKRLLRFLEERPARLREHYNAQRGALERLGRIEGESLTDRGQQIGRFFQVLAVDVAAGGDGATAHIEGAV